MGCNTEAMGSLLWQGNRMFNPSVSHKLYYGWVIVSVLSITQLTSWGILYYAFSVISPFMQAELGWSQVAVTGAFSLAMFLNGMMALPVGRWVDTRGTRALMSFGSCVAVLLLLAWARVDSLVGFYLVWAGIGLIMACVFYEPAFAAIAVWFAGKRGRALTILTFFGGLASLIFIPLTAYLVDNYGWRQALDSLALILAVVTILPHALFLRRAPADFGLLPDGAPVLAQAAQQQVSFSISLQEALRGMTFWWLTLAFSLTSLSSLSFTLYLIPYLLGRGYDLAFAALVTGSFGAMSVAGRLGLIPLSGKISQQILTALLFVVQALGLVVLLLGSGAWSVWCAVALFGAGSGALTPARAGLMADYYGPNSYGRINGMLSLLTTWARVLAPIGAGFMAALLGYNALWWLLALLTFLGAGAVLAAAQAHRRPEIPAQPSLPADTAYELEKER
jgi:MFS family permease